jgi:hypothetical protein
MKTYEPLTPPEIKRDEHGRFRHGKALAKTAKKKTFDLKSTNLSSGRGGARPGAGRPPGSVNIVTRTLKEAILAAGEIAGGKGGLTSYLVMLARNNSSAYAGLLGKILPTQLAADAESGGGLTKISFERIVCWPDGRREVEGVTPKALPSPDSSHAFPRPTNPTDDTNEGAVARDRFTTR